MVTPDMVGPAIQRWAEQQSRIVALILIGSRARATSDPRLAADAHSDWDFHVITEDPRELMTGDWIIRAGLPAPTVYVARLGRLGAATKVTAIVAGTLVDLMVIPVTQARLSRWGWQMGVAGRLPRLWQTLRGMAVVLSDGHRVLKGGPAWVNFYAEIARQVPPLRLTDEDIRRIADGFVCDYVSTRQKLARGELLATQRWLHHALAEANFQLLHELRLRQRQPSMPDARRLERLAEPAEVAAVRIQALPTVEELDTAIEQSATTLRELVGQLLGSAWRWPLEGERVGGGKG